jgi:hypothetical protein
MPVLETGLYRHMKSGQLYEVVGVALHTETHEALVVYRPHYDSPYELFVRGYDMFCELVEVHGSMVPRFQKVDEARSQLA